MSEVQATFFSKEWWLTVVVAGLAIHLAASYLKPQLDRMGGLVSRSWANRNKKHAYERKVRVERLRHNETARWTAAHDEIRHSLQSLMCLVWAGLGGLAFYGTYYWLNQTTKTIPHYYVVAAWVMVFLILFLVLGAISHNEVALRIENELKEAQRAQDGTTGSE
jgi:hypothetical protein